jgi:hypothetical protein
MKYMEVKNDACGYGFTQEDLNGIIVRAVRGTGMLKEMSQEEKQPAQAKVASVSDLDISTFEKHGVIVDREQGTYECKVCSKAAAGCKRRDLIRHVTSDAHDLALNTSGLTWQYLRAKGWDRRQEERLANPVPKGADRTARGTLTKDDRGDRQKEYNKVVSEQRQQRLTWFDTEKQLPLTERPAGTRRQLLMEDMPDTAELNCQYLESIFLDNDATLIAEGPLAAWFKSRMRPTS